MTPSGAGRSRRYEQRFERVMWKLRLVAILPVIMSLVSTAVTFTLGTMEICRSILQLLAGSSNKGFIAELLGGLVSGIDLYLIGIALLIFGHGIYELLISPIDAACQDDTAGNGLLDFRDLDQLKEKLVKVLVVALIVAAFKAMLALPITDGLSLALFCLSVLLLALSGYLVAGEGSRDIRSPSTSPGHSMGSGWASGSQPVIHSPGRSHSA